MGYLIIHSNELPSGISFNEKESFTAQEVQRMHCFSIPESMNESNPKTLRELNKKIYHATKRHVEDLMDRDL